MCASNAIGPVFGSKWSLCGPQQSAFPLAGRLLHQEAGPDHGIGNKWGSRHGNETDVVWGGLVLMAAAEEPSVTYDTVDE